MVFLLFVCLFVSETETGHEQGWGDREKIQGRLCANGTELHAGLTLMNHEVVT